MNDPIERQDAIDAIDHYLGEVKSIPMGTAFKEGVKDGYCRIRNVIVSLPSAQQNYDPGMKREFIRMAEYIDCLLQCSDEQKETLLGFISRLAEYIPWTESD